MTDGDVLLYVRITANPERMDSPWWAIARTSSPPDWADRILDGPMTYIVLRRQAEEFRAWASSLPCWRGDLFTFELVDLEEVMRTVGCATMRVQARLN